MEYKDNESNPKTDRILIIAIIVLLSIFTVVLVLSFFFPQFFKNNHQFNTNDIDDIQENSTYTQIETQSDDFQTTESLEKEVTDQKSQLELYKDDAWGFEFQYPASYQTVNDTYGWPHALVHLMPAIGGQSYEGQVEWWDSENQFNDTYGHDPKYIIKHPNNKNWITIYYYADPHGIWQGIIDSFKFN